MLSDWSHKGRAILILPGTIDIALLVTKRVEYTILFGHQKPCMDYNRACYHRRKCWVFGVHLVYFEENIKRGGICLNREQKDIGGTLKMQ